MPASHLIFLSIGLIILCVAWLPLFLRRAPLSLPMIAVGAGFLLSVALGKRVLHIHFREWAEGLALVALVVSVMGAGLKIDRRFSFRGWMSTWRLLAIAMPITICLIGVFAHFVLGLSIPLALLLGAILAPTDPVLAGDVQVGPPGGTKSNEVRFALTTEAGLNDGLAFPFVILGLTVFHNGFDTVGAWGLKWGLLHLLWNVAGGACAGYLLGRGMIFIENLLPQQLQLRSTRQSLVVLALTFIAYGAAELMQCNGIVAVFVTAITIRNSSDAIEYPRQLVGLATEIEQLLLSIVLLSFGGAIAAGLLGTVTVAEVAFVALTLVVARPIAVAISFIGSSWSLRQRLLTGFFGIKGLASLYYVAYAFARSGPNEPDNLVGIVGLTILCSIIFFGAASDVMTSRLSRYDQERAAEEREEKPVS